MPIDYTKIADAAVNLDSVSEEKKKQYAEYKSSGKTWQDFTTPTKKKLPTWVIWSGGIGVVLLIVGTIVLLTKKK